MKPLPFGVCAAVLLAVVPSVQADDEIFRRGGGKTLRGSIVKISRDHVEIKPRTGANVKVPADEIERLRFNAESPKLNLARNSERTGLLDRALEGYTEIVGSLNGPVKTDTEFLIARTKAKQAVADPAKVDDALKDLEQVLAAQANGFRYFETLNWLGQVQMAKGDYPAARTRFDALAAAPMKSYQMAGKVAIGRLLLAQDKPAEAQQQFDAVVAMQADTPAETVSRQDAMLGKARCQQLQQNYTEAIASLTEIVEKTSIEEHELHARANLQLGDCYRDQQKAKPAVRAYLKVHLIFNRNKALHAESMYQLTQLWPQAGRPDLGAETAADLRKLYPNNAWTKKLTSG